MKKFILFIGLFVVGYFATVTVSRAIWYWASPSMLSRNVIKGNIHTILIGASNGECSWDDGIILGSRNLAKSGRTYLSNLTTLKYAIEYNDCSVDTVIVCAGVPSFLYYTKDDLGQFERIISDEKTSVLSKKEFYLCHRDEFLYWKAFFTTSPLLSSPQRPMGEYLPLDRDKLGDPKAYESINRRLSECGGKDGFTEAYIREHCILQVKALKKIKEYCDTHNIIMVLYHSPIYKIPDMVSDKGYKNFILSELGDSVLIADYSRFQFPDTTYYADLEHINAKGAELFSKYIRCNGLKIQYGIDYCK